MCNYDISVKGVPIKVIRMANKLGSIGPHHRNHVCFKFGVGKITKGSEVLY